MRPGDGLQAIPSEWGLAKGASLLDRCLLQRFWIVRAGMRLHEKAPGEGTPEAMGGALDSLGEVSSDDQHTRHSLRNRAPEWLPHAHTGDGKEKAPAGSTAGASFLRFNSTAMIAAGS